MIGCYLELEGLEATTLPADVVGVLGPQDFVGGDSVVGQPLVPTDHPDHHVRHAVLGLL